MANSIFRGRKKEGENTKSFIIPMFRGICPLKQPGKKKKKRDIKELRKGRRWSQRKKSGSKIWRMGQRGG